MNSHVQSFVRILESEKNPSRVASAAEALLRSGASLEGAPPGQFVAALVESGPETEPALLNLARAWSRVEMSRAMLDALSGAATCDEKEQVAWLLKTVLADEHCGEAIDQVLDSHEEPQVRRWLLEALERMTFAGVLGWEQLEPVVSVLASEREPVLRAGLAGLLTALPWRASNAQLLEPLLLDDHYEVVSAAVHTLARYPEAARTLDAKILAHLRAHANPMVRQSVAVLEESIRRAG
jgi:hypothetical protein